MPEGAGILRRRGQERGMGRESYILLSKCKKPLNNNNKDNLKKKPLVCATWPNNFNTLADMCYFLKLLFMK